MNKILEFSNLLIENKKNNLINEELKSSNDSLSWMNKANTHSFSLAYRTAYNTLVSNNHPRTLITLDEEDIDYFKRKYLSKLNKEMQSKIDAIKLEYKKDIE